MTASNFMWAVVAGRGHSSEQLGRSFTEDLLNRPTVSAPPGSTQPMVGWERVYFVEGRD